MQKGPEKFNRDVLEIFKEFLLLTFSFSDKEDARQGNEILSDLGKLLPDKKRMLNQIVELKPLLEPLIVRTKYLLFDLEATRRENAYLKSLLAKRTD